MKTYLMFKEKVRQFHEDREIQDLIASYKVPDEGLSKLSRSFSSENAAALKAQTFELPALRTKGPGLERLDQLTVELLLGMR